MNKDYQPSFKFPCMCHFCERRRKIQKVIYCGKDNRRSELIQLVLDLHEALCYSEEEGEVDKAILDGSWPSSVKQLTKGLEKAKKIREQRIKDGIIRNTNEDN